MAAIVEKQDAAGACPSSVLQPGSRDCLTPSSCSFGIAIRDNACIDILARRLRRGGEEKGIMHLPGFDGQRDSRDRRGAEDWEASGQKREAKDAWQQQK